jgi:hypothetical protein
MWHCNVKCVKSGVAAKTTEFGRKRMKIGKELLPKAVRGIQTLYMTGTMKIHGNHVTVACCAVLLRAVD